MPWIVSVACSPWKHVFCDIPSRASGAKLRHSEEMVLIVSGILVKDRSGRITSICYAIEPSHLPCSIYSHQQGIRWSVIPFKSVWYHPLDFDGLNGFLHRFRVSRPAVPSFPKIWAKSVSFCVVGPMLWCRSGFPGTSVTMKISFKCVVVTYFGLSR